MDLYSLAYDLLDYFDNVAEVEYKHLLEYGDFYGDLEYVKEELCINYFIIKNFYGGNSDRIYDIDCFKLYIDQDEIKSQETVESIWSIVNYVGVCENAEDFVYFFEDVYDFVDALNIIKEIRGYNELQLYYDKQIRFKSATIKNKDLVDLFNKIKNKEVRLCC